MPNANSPIWTLEARDSVLFEVIASYFDLSDETMRREIWSARQATVDALGAKGISYDSLKNALVPQRDRLELALLFDTARIESAWYGFSVAERLIPLLPRGLLCSIRCGDLIIENQDLGLDLLQRHLVAHRTAQLGHTTQVYCVYVNNLSRRMLEDITSGLHENESFIGYVETSTASRMKDWLSLTLISSYLKAQSVVLTSHEDDVPNTVDQNTPGWPWEDWDYACRSIQSVYFDHFLSYKIERRVVPGLDSDTRFALTAISGRPLPLDGIPVELEEAKGKYLRDAHGSILERAGLGGMNDSELAAVIRRKISQSYIYNLRYLAAHGKSLFNVMLEIEAPESGKISRLLAALEYHPTKPALKVVTLY